MATEIHVKYLQSKIVVNTENEDAFHIWHSKQKGKVKLLSMRVLGLLIVSISYLQLPWQL
jgi:hypothetical protein